MKAVHSTHSEAETASHGRDVAATLGPGTVLLLVGDLGAGKTAFTRGIAEGLGIDPDQVSSPTFTLVQEYRGGAVPLVHADLYRLNDPREIEDLGLDELGSEAVLVIEWAEKLPRAPETAIRVRLEHRGENERLLTIERPEPGGPEGPPYN